MKKILPPIIFVVLLTVGVGLIARPDLVASWGGVVAPTRAGIVRETGESKPLSQELVELYAKASSIGVLVLDKDTLGKGRQPDPTIQPLLDAAKDKPLPQLVLQWPGGAITAKACPGTFAELKKELGK